MTESGAFVLAGTARGPRPSGSERTTLNHWLACGIFAAATGAAFLADASERQITTVIVYLLGVIIVGSIVGIRGGLCAAVIASLIYNFFLSYPLMQFSLTSLDDYVPLFAFTVGAAAAGLVTGRLKDRTLAAEMASGRLQALLDISRKLQAAIDMRHVPAAIRGFPGTDAGSEPEIYIVTAEAELLPLQISTRRQALAHRLLAEGRAVLVEGEDQALLLEIAAGAIGVLILTLASPAPRQAPVPPPAALVNLLCIALERCLLHERIAKTALIKRSDEFKTALLSSVSHDMRTPLGAITAAASSLARFGARLSEDDRADLLTIIQEQCSRLNRYTTNLLNLSRLQSGLDPEEFTECDAIEVLGTALSRIRPLCEKQRITQTHQMATASLRADPVMLEQVFYNILDNAVRYGPADVAIHVSTAPRDGLLIVTIADDGPGMAPPDMARIFERFYRASSSLNHEGSGLGLSIAKGFTEAFGGSIAAMRVDQLRGGTIIEITLPLLPSEVM